jgi:hypothetical protein
MENMFSNTGQDENSKQIPNDGLVHVMQYTDVLLLAFQYTSPSKKKKKRERERNWETIISVFKTNISTL